MTNLHIHASYLQYCKILPVAGSTFCIMYLI